MFRPLIRALALVALVMGALPGASQAEVVSIRAVQTGQTVGIDGAGLLALQGAGSLVLEIIRLQGNRVAFRDPRSGLFLRAGVGQQTNLAVVSPHIRAWETFEMTPTVGGVALRSVQSGQYVGADPANPRLTAIWGTLGLAQTWQVSPLVLAVPPLPGSRPSAIREFVGDWRLETLYHGGQPLALEAQAVRQAQFSLDALGVLRGAGGCNQFYAQLTAQGERFHVGDFLSTRRGCAGPVGQIELAFYVALTGAARFVLLQGGQWLDLHDETGVLRARLRRM